MPRKRKRGGGGAPVEATTERDVREPDERERLLVEIWSRLLRAGGEKKKRFRENARKVDRIFENVDHSDFFARPEIAAWASLEGVVAVPVNMAFQVRGWLGPELYQRNPTRKVTVRTRDGILAAMAKVIDKYLNYTPNETHLADEARVSIDESLLAGRSCLYTGVDPDTRLVTSWFVSIDDVLIDPDARRVEDAYWIAYRRREPLWKVRQTYPETADGLDTGDAVSSSKRAVDVEEPLAGDDEDPAYTGGATNDLVTVWEIYSKMGSGFRARDVRREDRGYDEGTRFRKVVVVPGYPRPLYEGGWEVPLYLDNAWPFTFLDLTPTRNQLWPVSLMVAAMPHQDAASLLSTVAMAKCKEHARDIYGVASDLEADVQQRIRSGGLSEVIPVDLGEQANGVSDLITRFPGGSLSPEIYNERAFHLEQFGQVTGLMPILKGEANEQQLRSATEADIRDKNARTRATDMSQRVEDWSSHVARAEGVLVRLELDAEEVQHVLGEPNDTDLGYLISVSFLGVELPVRLRPSDPDEPDAPIDLEGVSPLAGTYFETSDEALQVAFQLAQALPVINDQRVQAGMAPIMYDRVVVRPATVKDVWRDTSYLTAREICAEVTFRIEAGSTKRPDPNKAIDTANTVLSTVGQPALQAAAPSFAAFGPGPWIEVYNKALRVSYEAMQVSERDRVFLPEVPAGAMLPMAPGAAGAPAPGGQAPTPGPAFDRNSGSSFVGGRGQINAPRMLPARGGK